MGELSWPETLKLSTKDAVETSKPVERVYSLTSSPEYPIMNIFVPSLLKAKPVGELSWPETLKLSTKEAVETSKPVERVYSLTSSPVHPTTNIFVPLLLKAKPLGKSSWPETLKLSTKDAVETSKPVERVYSLTSSPVNPRTNIFVPSLLNVTLEGLLSWEDILKLSTNVGIANALWENKLAKIKIRITKSKTLLRFIKLLIFFIIPPIVEARIV